MADLQVFVSELHAADVQALIIQVYMADVQEVQPTDDSEAAAHTAAVVTELSLAMHRILQVSLSSQLTRWTCPAHTHLT